MGHLNIDTFADVVAEVTGIDLRSMTDAEFVQIRATFNAHGLLFLRDQKLSEDDHIGGGWHTDRSYDHEPALGSILVALEAAPACAAAGADA